MADGGSAEVGVFEKDEMSVGESDGIAAVLDFWFGPWAVPGYEGAASPEQQLSKQQTWFSGGPEIDNIIRAKFLDLILKAGRGELAAWEETPRGALSLVVLLDQFTRNSFRDSGEAFSRDHVARDIARRALERGFDEQLPIPMRLFFYFPFEHSEDLADQDRSVKLFAQAAAAASSSSSPDAVQKATKAMLEFAERHRVVVRRFGRFPHRNGALGRESTPEEAEYLQGGKWF